MDEAARESDADLFPADEPPTFPHRTRSGGAVRSMIIQPMMQQYRAAQVCMTAFDEAIDAAKRKKTDASRVTRFLIVDNDSAFLRTTQRLLQKQAPQLTVETSEGAMDALLKIGTFRPHAVLVDAYMPCMNGMELCRRLQQSPEMSHIKIIAISGRLTAQLRASFIKAGAVAVYPKPLDMRLLLYTLNPTNGRK